jgi:hypothetical protein
MLGDTPEKKCEIHQTIHKCFNNATKTKNKQPAKTNLRIENHRGAGVNPTVGQIFAAEATQRVGHSGTSTVDDEADLV